MSESNPNNPPQAFRNAQGAFNVDGGEIHSLNHLAYLVDHVPAFGAVAKQAAIRLGKHPRHGESVAHAMNELYRQQSPMTPAVDVMAVVNRIAREKNLL